MHAPLGTGGRNLKNTKGGKIKEKGIDREIASGMRNEAWPLNVCVRATDRLTRQLVTSRLLYSSEHTQSCDQIKNSRWITEAGGMSN